MKTPWTESRRCRSRAFCGPCRTDAAWRQTLVACGRVTERDFDCPHGITTDNLPNKRPPGPGTQLKAMLALFGIHATERCACRRMAAKMDREGPQWCREHIGEIVDVMRTESNRRHLLFMETAAKLIIRRAIRQAEK